MSILGLFKLDRPGPRVAGSTGKAPSSQPTIPALMQLPSSSLEMKHVWPLVTRALEGQLQA